jgi:hypothetical protein
MRGCLRIAYCLHDCALRTLIQTIQLLHVILVKDEAEDVDVAGNAGWCIALRERHESLLQTPSDENLARLLVVRLREAEDGFVVRLLVANEGAVGLDDDVVLLAVFDTIALLAPGVEL